VSREYPERPIVGVGAVIIVPPGGGVVLVRRKFNPLAGQWSLPGGAVDLGETLEQAIVREVLEETGLTINVEGIVDVFDRVLLDPDGRVRYHYVLIDYVCCPTGGALCAGSDVSDAIVADPGDLGQYDLTPKTIEVIRKSFAASR
jgi:8-oxo-dGTP diphosphatase